MKHKLICVLGPTASGKTRYAVQLARDRDGEIISADSRQVYRGMDIGTGKDLSEYGEGDSSVRYHLINIVNAGEKYNLFRYITDFQKVYKDIIARGKQPIICGGSGLYIEAVTMGYQLPEVPEDTKIREELERFPMEVLIEKLKRYRTLHNTSDIDSKKRLIRALEIEIYKEKNGIGFITCEKIETTFIGIDVSREERIKRIDDRLDKRLSEGMVEEVRRLLENGVSAEDLIYYGLEYKYITKYILGELSFEKMRLELATAIHQFAKRQMTWFRGMERRGIDISWINLK